MERRAGPVAGPGPGRRSPPRGPRPAQGGRRTLGPRPAHVGVVEQQHTPPVAPRWRSAAGTSNARGVGPHVRRPAPVARTSGSGSQPSVPRCARRCRRQPSNTGERRAGGPGGRGDRKGYGPAATGDRSQTGRVRRQERSVSTRTIGAKRPWPRARAIPCSPAGLRRAGRGAGTAGRGRRAPVRGRGGGRPTGRRSRRRRLRPGHSRCDRPRSRDRGAVRVARAGAGGRVGLGSMQEKGPRGPADQRAVGVTHGRLAVGDLLGHAHDLAPQRERVALHGGAHAFGLHLERAPGAGLGRAGRR